MKCILSTYTQNTSQAGIPKSTYLKKCERACVHAHTKHAHTCVFLDALLKEQTRAIIIACCDIRDDVYSYYCGGLQENQ